jgi:hypothetical protein
MLVICPSRGRPDAASELQKTFLATRQDERSQLVFAIDSDDVALEDYAQHARGLTIHVGPAAGSMNAALNGAAHALLHADHDVTVVGFVGDDHRFRTAGWDVAIGSLLADHPGVAYGDDKNWGERLPTMWFLSRQVAGFFGMGLKTLRHLYIDNYWLELAGAADCLTYLPDVVIEHMHPAYGKGEWDESYRRNNSPEMYGADGTEFARWKSQRMPQDVALLRELLSAQA